MNTGRYIISQVLDLVHWQTLSRLVQRYDAGSKVLSAPVFRTRCYERLGYVAGV